MSFPFVSENIFQQTFGLFNPDLSGFEPLINLTCEVRYRTDAVAAPLAGKNYLLGQDFTAADIQLASTIRLARDLGVVDEYGNILAWIGCLLARPALLKVMGWGFKLANLKVVVANKESGPDARRQLARNLGHCPVISAS